jgi:pimeloyl-ACP methyl ester carboxylesterase
VTAPAPFRGEIQTMDGLRMAYLDYDHAPPGRAPVICLPGLTRCHRDFGPLAARLSARRRVLCPDMRGRGLSDRDPDWRNYNVVTETGDVLRLMDVLGIERAAFVGASRGGIATMLIASLRPGAVLGAVLNDVGPRIERGGLLRLIATLSLTPDRFADWPACVAAVRHGHGRQFPTLTDAEWDAYARRLFADVGGEPRRDFDWTLTRATETAVEGDVPELWTQFEALREAPVLAIRGALSDILSPETLGRMAASHPDFAAVTLPDRGHCPFLDEPEAVAAIETLLEKVDDRWRQPPPIPAPLPTPPPSAPPPPA